MYADIQCQCRKWCTLYTEVESKFPCFVSWPFNTIFFCRIVQHHHIKPSLPYLPASVSSGSWFCTFWSNVTPVYLFMYYICEFTRRDKQVRLWRQCFTKVIKHDLITHKTSWFLKGVWRWFAATTLKKLQIKQDFIIQITCPDTDPSLIPDANGATLIVGCDALQRSEPSRTKMAAVKSGLFSFTCLEMTLLYHCHIEKTFIWSYTAWYWLKEWSVWDVSVGM